MEDKIKININTNGIITSLSIKPEDEELYRKAGKLLNERIDIYNRKFRSLDLPYTNILNMVAYEFAVEYIKLLNTKETMPQDEINELSELLNDIDLD